MSKPGASTDRERAEEYEERNVFGCATAVMIIVALAVGGLLGRHLAFETVQVEKTRKVGFSGETQSYVDEEIQLRKLTPLRLAWRFGLALLGTFAYPLLGALAVGLSQSLRSWAWSDDEPERWPLSIRVLLGAFWPVTFIASLIIYAFLGLVRRLF